MNFVILKGHVGQEPNVRTLENGRKVATFTMATTGRYKAKDGSWQEEPPVWHNIVAWGHLADHPVQKGNLVEIKGKITNRTYDDKEGVKRYTTEIVATDLDIIKVMRRVDAAALPSAQDDPIAKRLPVDADGFTQPNKSDTGNQAPPPNLDEDLPF